MNNDKKDLEKFIKKCSMWACNTENIEVDRVLQFQEYLNSDEFYNLVAAQKLKAKTQKEFNINVTDLVGEKIIELLQITEHDMNLNEILNSNNIKTENNGGEDKNS